MMDNYNEQDIILRLQDSRTSRQAFTEIVDKYSQMLYWHIRRMVIYHEDADDVLQNTFIKAWNNISNFRGDSKLSTWLYRIAYNESLTFLSHNHLSVSINDENENFAERLESDIYFDGDKIQIMLQEAVNRLPDKQKAVFNMKYFNEMKYEDMAEIFGTSIGALKASYHLAVKKIESFFNERD